MYSVGFNRYGTTPPVVKNLILINVVMLVAYWALQARYGFDLNAKLGLYYVGSPNFRPIQLITHMFLHGGFWHIFLNMFGLWMFGKILENVWGSKRFFVYYMVTGLGAAGLHLFVLSIQYYKLANLLSPNELHLVFSEGTSLFREGKVFTDGNMQALQLLLNTPTVGASGAVFGILLAFGMLFPNTELMLLFPPIPIKAKWVVIGYGLFELYEGLSQPGDNVAHFAHLGGMLFGFILIKYWNTKRTDFY